MPSRSSELSQSNKLVKFLRELLLLIRTPPPKDNERSPLQIMVAKQLDHLLPFREYGSSRQHWTKPEGPFTATQSLTQAGFFRTLIGQGVIGNTPAGHNCPSFFSNLEEWQTFEESVKIYGQKYICNKNAYGKTTSQCSPRHADSYWRTSASWPGFLAKYQDKVPFMALYNWLQAQDLPQMGMLQLYLLTGDYTYTGVAQSPTIQEMASIIYHLNKGALKGLQLLGHVPNAATREACQCALKRVISAMLSVQKSIS
ncbi:hypothetical protein JB92DRAFT_2831348 [Gautieria morchelliformis]|nr:hypothetical protein JB92DRAFT_2831348 [Gautieria morchelliformis]